MPIAQRTLVLSNFVTMSAPSHAPAVAATSMRISVKGSMSTKPKNKNASTKTGKVSPTLRVPGMLMSSTEPFILYIAVEGANEPMPSVSKKLATKPTMLFHQKCFFCFASSAANPGSANFFFTSRPTIHTQKIKPITHNSFIQNTALPGSPITSLIHSITKNLLQN